MNNKNLIEILVRAKDDASKTLDSIGGSMERTERRSTALIKGLAAAGVAIGAAGTAALAAGTAIGFKFNSSVEQAQAQIMAFTKDAGKTAQILSYVKAEAAKTQFSFTDMARAAAGLIPASKQSGVALKELIEEAEILAALNPAEGLVGAAFSLKEALSGDFVSIVERFNLPRKRLNELKEQGVPAIQAIRTALREMGIDYELVAKQGQTTAARWDQLKDKFTILAGTITQPIFQKVSEGLDRLSNSIDFEAWGRKATAALNSVFRAAGETYTAIQALVVAFQTGQAAGDGLAWRLSVIGANLRAATDAVRNFFGPSVIALINSIRDNLIPALDRLINTLGPVLIPTVERLAKALGSNLAAALWVVINGLRVVIDTVSWLIQVFLNAEGVARRVATTIGNVFSELGRKVGHALDGVERSLPVPLLTTLDIVRRVANEISSIINGITGKLDKVQNAAGKVSGGLRGLVGKLPGFATGGFTGRGGSDEVAGIVHKGEYVVPKQYVDQSTGLPMGGGGVTINQTNNIFNQVDLDQANIELGWRLARA